MCNAWNHSFDCMCGWGGDSHFGINQADTLNDLLSLKIDSKTNCNSTECPRCGAEVFFLKHNGGSVWLDPPLSPPWHKHPCFENMQSERNKNTLGENEEKMYEGRFKIPKVILSHKLVSNVCNKKFTKEADSLKYMMQFVSVKKILAEEADAALFYAFFGRNCSACQSVYLAACVMMKDRVRDFVAYFAAHGILFFEDKVIIKKPVPTLIKKNGESFKYSLAIPSGDFAFDKKHKDRGEREEAVLFFLNSHALTFKEFCLGVKKLKDEEKADKLALKKASDERFLIEKNNVVVGKIKYLESVNMAEKILGEFNVDNSDFFIENVLPFLEGSEYSLFVEKLNRRFEEKKYEDFLFGDLKKLN